MISQTVVHKFLPDYLSVEELIDALEEGDFDFGIVDCPYCRAPMVDEGEYYLCRECGRIMYWVDLLDWILPGEVKKEVDHPELRPEYKEQVVQKKVYTALWACPRQLTKGWGCPTIIDRMVEFLGEKPDVYFGVTDGIRDPRAITVDINPDNNPTVVADWKHLPFEDNAFEFAFWDPPYDERYDSSLREISRVTSRRLAILHQLVYPNPDRWIKRAIIGVTTGPNMRIRCLQIYDRRGARLKKLKAEKRTIQKKLVFANQRNRKKSKGE